MQETIQVENRQVPYFILGDPAYPLLYWLLKGYTGILTPEKDNFNVHMNSARVYVEIAFGRLKARFRCLMKRLDVHYSFVPEIVATCCTLHNILEENKDPFQENWLEAIEEAQIVFQQPNQFQKNQERDNLNGSELRDFLCSYLARNFPLRQSRRT